jgi:ligand-binding sensor domain-containing protein/signal transduction histidine kinase
MIQLSPTIKTQFRQLLGLLVCILMCFPVISATSFSFPPKANFFQSIGDANSIPEYVVTSLAQDKRGLIWIGTAAGLVQYDGYRFRRFVQDQDDPNSLSGNFVRDILLRKNGELWIASEPGGVSIFQPEKDHFVAVPYHDAKLQQRFGQSVVAMTEDTDGNMWIGGRNGILKWPANSVNPILYDQIDGSPLQHVRALLSTKDGTLWLGNRQGLFYLPPKADKFMPVPPSEAIDKSLLQAAVLSLAQASDGSIWVGTSNKGAYVLQLKAQQLTALTFEIKKHSEQPIYSLLQISEDEIWLGGFGGINRFSVSQRQNLGQFEHKQPNRFSLAHADVRALLLDHAGQIWVGGYGGGVQRYNGNNAISSLYTQLTANHKLSSTDISSILELQNGNIWLGSRGEGIDVLDPDIGVTDHYAPAPGDTTKLQSGWVTSMAQHSNGEIWLGVNPGQLYRFSPTLQQFTQLTAAQGYRGANVRRIFIDSNDRLWLGTNEGLSYWADEQQGFVRIHTADGHLLRDYVNDLTEDAQQRLWIATGSSGLYQLDMKSLPATAISIKASIHQPQSILGLLLDRDKSSLWFDTPLGLYRLNTLKSNSLPVSVQFSNTTLKQDFGANLLQDAQGRLWSQKYLYTPDSGILYELTQADGVNIGTAWFRSYYQLNNGTMIFGGSEGLLVIQPEKFKPWKYQPAIITTDVKLDNKHISSVAAMKGITISSDQKSLSIEFAALDYSAPQRLKYRYQLEGFDQQWRETDSSQRLVSYTNLWPGHYRLHVHATNRSGDWSENTLSIPLTVLPAFWQTLWFTALMILMAIAIFMLAFRMRTSVIRRRSRELSTLVEQRTQELRSAQQNLIEKEKMASLGQMVAGIAHEINTPVGVSVTATSLLVDNFDTVQKQFQQKTLTASQLQRFINESGIKLQMIGQNLQRAAGLIDNFKQVAVDRSSNKIQRINLSEFLKQCLLPFQSQLKPHQIEIECQNDQHIWLRAEALEVVISHFIQNSLLHGFSNRTGGTIKITAQIDAQRCVLHFYDNGHGIASDLQPQVFDPFVTSKRGSNCTGLGLHLCYNLVTQVLNGSIQMQSTLGEGTLFILSFPLSSPSSDSKS